MRNTISLLLIIILAIVTPVLLLVTSVKVNIATATFLKRELVRQDIYGLAQRQIDQQLDKVVIDPQYPITKQEITNLVHQIVTPAWLQQNIESVLDRFSAWLNSPSGETLSLPIDLRQPKSVLTTEVDALLAAKLPNIKPCPNKRQPKEEQGICQFSGMTLTQLKEQLKHAGLDPELVSNLLPDVLDLVNPDLSKLTGATDPDQPNDTAIKSAQIKQNLENVKDRYRLVMELFRYAWIIYGLLIALYVAINVRPGWHHLARWLGALCVILGVFPIALSVASAVVVERVVLPRLHLESTTVPEVEVIVPGLIRDVRSTLFTWPQTIGIALLILGMGAIVAARWLPKRPIISPSKHHFRRPIE